jgi:HTH-type transcriptional regulator/antitoxin HipB
MNHLPWSWVADPAALGAAIRDARRRRDLQQADLAERLGVSRMTVSRMERGEAVSIDTVLRALAECGVALVVAPKFSKVTVTDESEGPDAAMCENCSGTNTSSTPTDRVAAGEWGPEADHRDRDEKEVTP